MKGRKLVKWTREWKVANNLWDEVVREVRETHDVKNGPVDKVKAMDFYRKAGLAMQGGDYLVVDENRFTAYRGAHGKE